MHKHTSSKFGLIVTNSEGVEDDDDDEEHNTKVLNGTIEDETTKRRGTTANKRNVSKSD